MSKGDNLNGHKRKISESDDVELKKPGREEKFYLKKLSSEEITQLLISSTTESSSVESDGGSNEFWAISKSPLKKPSSNHVNGAKKYNQSDSPLVSPVKLKRRPDFNNHKNVTTAKVDHNPRDNYDKMAKLDEEIEKEILAQIENSPKMSKKSKSEVLKVATPKSKASSSKAAMNSTTPSKENLLKSKLTDSESEQTSVALESINYVNSPSEKSPHKISKIEGTPKKLEVILTRLTPDIVKKYALKDVQNKSKLPLSEVSKKLECFEDDLAIPLDLMTNNLTKSGSKSSHKKSQNKCHSRFNDVKFSDGSDSDNDTKKIVKNNANTNKDDIGTPDSVRKSLRITNKNISQLKREKNEREKSPRRAVKMKNYLEIDSDESADDLSDSTGISSTVVSDLVKTKFKSSHYTTKKETPKSKPTAKAKIKFEMDENSSSDSTEESNSDSIQISRFSRKFNSAKDNIASETTPNNSVSKTRSKVKADETSSPNISSPGRFNLRKRSEIKQPIPDDFDVYGRSCRRSTTANSPKTTPSRNTRAKEASPAIAADKTSDESPRVSKRILARDSPKKISSEISKTPRSSIKNTNLLPLVDSVEKIVLRNRKEIKKTWGEDFEVNLGKRLSIVDSPKTPSHSLRKLVLESTTRSAKKKLLMDSDSSSDDEDYIYPLKRTPRKQAETTPNKTPVKTPSKSAAESRAKRTPSKTTPCKTPSKSTPRRKNEPSTPCTPRTVRRVGQGFLTPMVEERCRSRNSCSVLEALRVKLHLSTVPSSLPCRLTESKNIKSFITCKINDKTGGCMYISGVPGTGKTATVHAVIKTLQQEAVDGTIIPFDFVEVNSLRLAEARQAYVRIWQSLSGSKLSTEQAHQSLEKKFCGKPSRPTVLLIDELDYICNRRQDVVYNVLDWSTKKNSKLIVLTIANTMDLPERTLKGRVTSRMGLTRLVFQPYTFQQLQEIVMNRIEGSSSFDPDAVQFVARKVAAVSGDARRALDICRRATELLKNDSDKVTLEHVNKTLSQIYLSRRVQAIKHCTYMGQLLLRSIRDETLRTGVEETTVRDVFSHLVSLCNLEGSWQPTLGQVLTLCRTLSTSSLISLEKARHDILTKITLNVSADDVHYALSC